MNAGAPTEAVVLAGGLGTRLRDAVPDLPKALAPVAGRPFLAWLLDMLASEGIERAILATGYLGDRVEAAIGHRHAGMAVAYAREAEPLGTGGAVRDALPHARGARVLVLNGDTFLRVPFAAMAAAAPDAPLAIAVTGVPDTGRFGAVLTEGDRIRGFREKGGAAAAGLINGGAYLVDRDLPALRRSGAFSFERDILERMVREGADVRAHPVPGPFIDIGTPGDFARAQTLLPAWCRDGR